ncbi:MAG TPA: prephenate dehydratase [Blastocatellia bacterium]|jgi:prephenate dehydratase|nr:prephenate dehydratase [Blastocatellia bacterium]
MADGARIRVAYQGERGAFSEDAARKLLVSEIETIPNRTFEEMFESVSSGAARCAVVPIENSLAGSVHKNYDLLIAHDLTIIGETNIRIVHNLIAPRRVPLSAIRRVYSHPVALAQCERFLRANPHMEVAPAYDTAGGVKMVVENNRGDEAAIAGATAAKVYGASIVAKAIEDNAKNFTRFLLLARADDAGAVTLAAAGRARKTTIVFRVANRPGALFRSLAAFALRDIDLAKIESRPIEGRPWEYSFYLDLIGDRREPHVERAVAHLAEMAESIRVLGSYSTKG